MISTTGQFSPRRILALAKLGDKTRKTVVDGLPPLHSHLKTSGDLLPEFKHRSRSIGRQRMIEKLILPEKMKVWGLEPRI
jgi:hypothetical protein